jgi:hypothetical protein
MDGSGAVVVSGAVFYDWVLDLLVHRPDLPLYDDSSEGGFGFWNFPIRLSYSK